MPRSFAGWLLTVAVFAGAAGVFSAIMHLLFGLTAAVFVGALGAMNGLIVLSDWGGSNVPFAEGLNRLPSETVIDLIWIVLFMGMATAFWLLASSDEPSNRRKAGEVFAFVVFCLSYPLFIIWFPHADLILAGNFLIIVWSSYLAGVLRDVSRPAAVLILLPALWVCYATWALTTPAGQV